jgi:hypothetical protein
MTRWLDTHEECCEGNEPRMCCDDCTGPLPGRRNIRVVPDREPGMTIVSPRQRRALEAAGVMTATRPRVVPDREAWLWENETAKGMVDEGLRQARAGNLTRVMKS